MDVIFSKFIPKLCLLDADIYETISFLIFGITVIETECNESENKFRFSDNTYPFRWVRMR